MNFWDVYDNKRNVWNVDIPGNDGQHFVYLQHVDVICECDVFFHQSHVVPQRTPLLVIPIKQLEISFFFKRLRLRLSLDCLPSLLSWLLLYRSDELVLMNVTVSLSLHLIWVFKKDNELLISLCSSVGQQSVIPQFIYFFILIFFNTILISSRTRSPKRPE